MSSLQNPPRNVRAFFDSSIKSMRVLWDLPVGVTSGYVYFIYVDGNVVAKGISSTVTSYNIVDKEGIQTAGNGAYDFDPSGTYGISMKSGYRQSSNNIPVANSDFSNTDTVNVIANVNLTVRAPNGNTKNGIITLGQYDVFQTWIISNNLTVEILSGVATYNPTSDTAQTFISWWEGNGGFVIPPSPPPPTISCVMYTINFCDGLSQGFTSTQAIYDELKNSTYQCPVTFSPAFASSCDGSQDLITIRDIILSHQVLPPPPPPSTLTNNLVTVAISPTCGYFRAVLTDAELQSLGNRYTINFQGKVDEPSNYQELIQAIASCPDANPPPPPPSGGGSGIFKGGLMGLTMGLLALLFIGDRKRK